MGKKVTSIPENMNNSVTTRLGFGLVQGLKTIKHPRFKRLPLKIQGSFNYRQFSCVSSVVGYHNSWGDNQQKKKKLSGYSVYKVQTRNMTLSELSAIIYSPEKNPALALGINMLETVHDTIGLPWWGTIVLCTFTLKTSMTFPLAIYSEIIRCRYELMMPYLDEKMQRSYYNTIQTEKAQVTSPGLKQVTGNPFGKKLTTKKVLWQTKRQMYKEHKCHPVKIFVNCLVQVPIWVSLSLAVRYLSGWKLPSIGTIPAAEGMSTEGLFWFKDMTVFDPTFILPITFLILNLTIMQINSGARSITSPWGRSVKWFLRGYLCFITVVSAFLPSCLSFYWTVSCIYAVGQNFLILSPRFRRLCGIPRTSIPSLTPYKDIYERFLAFLKNIFNKLS